MSNKIQLTCSDYARALGISRTAVLKRIYSGNLAPGVTWEKVGFAYIITAPKDFAEQEKAAMRENTRGGKRKGGGRPKQKV